MKSPDGIGRPAALLQEDDAFDIRPGGQRIAAIWPDNVFEFGRFVREGC